MTTSNQLHILNGDALRLQFPKSIIGKQSIIRECLIDGDITGNSIDEFLANRSKFFEQEYNVSEENYQKTIRPEIDKIISLHENDIANLWFEDDLFCQVHLWFSSYLIEKFTKVKEVYLIRPTSNLRYGFGGMSEPELEQAYQNRLNINEDDLHNLASLWKLYQHKKHPEMLDLAMKHADKFPFLLPAIKANAERSPEDGTLGKPQRTLLEIMDQLQSNDFSIVFKEFCKREAIYGFGDMQVKRLLSELQK